MEEKTIETDSKANGQNKCPKCGATDISLNVKKGLLRCNFCRHEFEAEKVQGLETDISKLEGDNYSTGTQNIDADAENLITLKCSSSGAEVVIGTPHSTQARCHWCRNTLSINQQIPNGAVPDVVLPFKLTKNEAKENIQKYVDKKRFYAHPQFKKEFTVDNVMGVYFPYMVVDVNAHADFSGEAEHEIRHYTVRSGDNETTYYDADVYEVEREFDITINGLTVESSIDKLDTTSKENTNNIINSIMPFDTENCVKWDPNYIRGFTSEKRDMNVDKLKPLVEEEAKDIARFAANETMQFYDRGACWKKQDLDVKGTQWQSAYLPVWLYSYQQKKKSRNVMHYVALNARTKEIIGSIPLNKTKLLIVSALVEALSGLGTFLLNENWESSWILLASGIIYYCIIYGRYRNSGARHYHETETKKEMSNIRKVDNKLKTRKRLRDSKIEGQNNNVVGAKNAVKKLIKGEKGKKK